MVANQTNGSRSPLDGVELAVLNGRLQAVVRAMMNTLGRTGRSGVLNTARDFSCCVLTRDGDLLAAGESLPIHVMSGPEITARWLNEWHPKLRAGDAYLHNSPYHGNSHAADHCLLVPVIDEDGAHRFTVLAKAHQADCGDSEPTTYMATARDVYEEGALIFAGMQIQRSYEDIDDVVRSCKARIRVPDQWWGDYLSLVGAARIGERLLLGLAAEVGWDHLEHYAARWFDYAEERMTAALCRLPSGNVRTTTRHDPIPGLPDGVEITADLHIDGNEGRVEIDLTHNVDCLPCGLNLTESTSRTAAMVGVFNSIYDVPVCAGSFRRIDVKLRENCVVGIPRHPASCSVATTNIADRLANAVQRAIADHAPGHGLAEVGLTLPPSVAVISGRDPRVGNAAFVNEVYLALTGGAGAPQEDAWLLTGHVGNGGFMLRDSVEIDELRFPLRIYRQYLLSDTEGAGRFRGAPGALVEYGPVGTEMDVMYASDGTQTPARGCCGGLSGGLADQHLRRADGSVEPLEPCARLTLTDGEAVISISSGGGGYGDPRERDPERVLSDVREGLISPERARDVYGTAIDPRACESGLAAPLRSATGVRSART